jgi:flagellar biosynthesis protein FlhG
VAVKKLWSVGGGKGGIGKSIFTLGLGITLARLGKKVILVDGDLGGANLHTLMGVRYPAFTLEDFILKKVERLEDIILDTQVEGIGLICGADDILGAANPKFAQKIRLLNQMEYLPADFVLLDLGAGTSFNTLDFFNYSPGKIALFTNQSTSLQNVYGFLKSALFRLLFREFAKDEDVLWLLNQSGRKGAKVKVDSMADLLEQLQGMDQAKYERLQTVLAHFDIYLVVNMVKSDVDIKGGQIIQKVCEDFLGLQPQILGYVVFDAAVETAVNQMLPFPLHQDDCQAAQGLRLIACRILQECGLPIPANASMQPLLGEPEGSGVLKRWWQRAAG